MKSGYFIRKKELERKLKVYYLEMMLFAILALVIQILHLLALNPFKGFVTAVGYISYGVLVWSIYMYYNCTQKLSKLAEEYSIITGDELIAFTLAEPMARSAKVVGRVTKLRRGTYGTTRCNVTLENGSSEEVVFFCTLADSDEGKEMLFELIDTGYNQDRYSANEPEDIKE